MAVMTTEKKLSPEGELIETARRRTGLAQNAAAREVGISGTRWRQIVKGEGRIEGSRVAVRGGGATVAKMAILVGVTAEEMEQAGRPDVAREIVDAAPLAAPADRWDGELGLGEGPLMEDEELRWRDGRGRLFEYRVAGFVHEATLPPTTSPEDAVLVLRSQLAQRVHQVTGMMMGRPQVQSEM